MRTKFVKTWQTSYGNNIDGWCKSLQKLSHNNMEASWCKVFKQDWCQKPKAKSIGEQVDGGLARTCKEYQETPTMLKAKIRIHLNELMHELAKTCKNSQATPRK